jgi:hypothetical protein
MAVVFAINVDIYIITNIITNKITNNTGDSDDVLERFRYAQSASASGVVENKPSEFLKVFLLALDVIKTQVPQTIFNEITNPVRCDIKFIIKHKISRTDGSAINFEFILSDKQQPGSNTLIGQITDATGNQLTSSTYNATQNALSRPSLLQKAFDVYKTILKVLK